MAIFKQPAAAQIDKITFTSSNRDVVIVGSHISKLAPLAIMLNSLRRQMLVLWLLTLTICLGLGILLYGLFGQTEGVRITEARNELQGACLRITQRYEGASQAARSVTNAGGLREVVLQLTLADSSGIEGGIWNQQQGFVAYAYPTYQGSSAKSDIPDAERSNIEATASKVLATGKSALYSRSSTREVLLLEGCPLDKTSIAWTMTRVPAVGTGAFRRLLIGMSLLLGTVAMSAIVVGWALRRWNRKLAEVEQVLAEANPTHIPSLPLTGLKELDRLGNAITGYATRMADAQAETNRLTAELARHDRLVSLGRMTATVAHEIRNPIATMRLTAENALSEGYPDESGHLKTLLAQIHRLDGVIESLLSMVQPIRLRCQDVAVLPWMQSMAAAASALPNQPDVELLPVGDANLAWSLDREQVSRALDNLLRNAARHSDADATIQISVSRISNALHIDVANRGPAVPAELRDQLFEPFVTGRTDGNGLGLALVREIAQAHGGSVRYSHTEGVTHFTLEFPWRAS